MGEYLALTGQVIGGADAVYAGLADAMVDSAELPQLWEQMAAGDTAALAAPRSKAQPAPGPLQAAREAIDRFFGLPDIPTLVQALETDGSDWARETAATLRKRSPLMLHVVLELVRRARSMGLADDLRMERGLVRQCFALRPGVASETVEGIRALAVDKDHAPRWNPARIEDVTREMVEAFFVSPWPAHAHPLRQLAP